MKFDRKALYKGPVDELGIPLLDYQGRIGKQYNPIAVSQWGLGNYNLWKDTNDEIYFNKFILSADWLVQNIKKNDKGLYVWMHYFDFEYRDILKSPWYSGLAQGQGISLLVRSYKETNNIIYKNIIEKVIDTFNYNIEEGGVNYQDSSGYNWIEEYIVFPPTHILNGFIWGLWGLYDYAIFFNNKQVLEKFNDYNHTIKNNLQIFDLKYWSKYEQSGTFLPMIASEFYHRLHIVQLKIMFIITKDEIYKKYYKKWDLYLKNISYKYLSKLHKIIFKVFYY